MVNTARLSVLGLAAIAALVSERNPVFRYEHASYNTPAYGKF